MAEARPPLPPARDRGNDRHLVSLLERGLGALEEADVLLVDVDVDEAAQLAAVLHQPVPEPGVLALQHVDQVVNVGGVGLHFGGALGQRAKRGGNANQNGHSFLLGSAAYATVLDSRSASARSNAASDGRVGTSLPRRCFRPARGFRTL